MLRTIINERFAFAVSDPLLEEGGATLLDLESGAFFSMNATAADIWRRFLEGESRGAIAKDIAAKSGMSEVDAMTVADGVLSPVETGIAAEAVDESGWPAVQPTPYDITPDGENSFVFSHLQQKLFRFDPESRIIKRIATLSETEWKQHLWSFSPNLLAMMGVPTLHAAGVMDGDQVVLFSGPSGAGKTTTARMWAEANDSAIVCEDKAVLGESDGGMFLFRDAELVITEWVSRTSNEVLNTANILIKDLLNAAKGPTSNVSAIGFLDLSQRRPGLKQIERRALTEKESVAFILRQSFTGTRSRHAWASTVKWSCQWANFTLVSRLYVPSDLAELRVALSKASRSL
jgi:hypothetical protein